LILAGMMLALFLAALDQTIVATAAPSVVSALGVFNLFAWVFATYMLASTAVTPIAGKLSDTYGRRWVYLIGVTIFMVGSAMSGASQSMEWLIFSRGMQGLGAGALFPVSMATIADLYPPAKRGKVQGLFAAVFGVSSIIGPTAGGYLVDNVSWRWIFYVNLPTGLLALVVLFLAMRDTAPHGPRPTIDYLGAAVLTAAITTTLLIIIWGGSTYEWLSAPIIGMGVGAVALWVLAWVVESRAESPILPVAFFKVQVFTVSMISRLFIGGGMFGAILFIPLYVQVVIGSSATDSGLVLTPMMLGIVFASGISGFALSRFKRYKYLTFVGILLMIGGFYLLSTMTPETSSGEAVRNMLMMGTGLGITFPLYTVAVQNAFRRREMGVVSSAGELFRGVGGTIGSTVFGLVMANRFAAEMDASLLRMDPDHVASVPPGLITQMVKNPQQLGRASAIPPQFLDLIQASMSTAITGLFVIGLGLMVVALVVNFWLPEAPLRDTWDEPEGQEAADETGR
jgi:EmrB/QacA subfamily drug resistance transporter